MSWTFTPVAITGIGLTIPGVGGLAELRQDLRAGTSRLVPSTELAPLPSDLAGLVGPLDLKSVLRRRRDKKLLARPAQLALVAASAALGEVPTPLEDVGLYLGVGREPPDQGDAEPALAAAARDGQLDPARLVTEGRDLYPPLLPLKTLPNMALAHVSINLGLQGENGAWAGGAAAAMRAMWAAVRAIQDGRVEVALAGGADSQVDLGSARDRLRMGAETAPGEAAVIFRMEAVDAAFTRGAPIFALVDVGPPEGLHDQAWPPRVGLDAVVATCGDAGAGSGALALALALADARAGAARGQLKISDPGQPPISFAVKAPQAC